MKKTTLIISILFTFFLAWCTVNTDEISDAINEYFAIDEIAGLFKNWKKEMLQQQINFENDLKCQERGDGLKSQYKNYHSIYYNVEANTCYVKYYNKENIIEESPIGSITTVNNTEKKQQTQQTTQYTTQQTNQSQGSNTSSNSRNIYCEHRLEQYEEAMWEYRYCLKEKEERESGLAKLCLQPIKPSCY